jgi:hypothetical protein
MLKLIWVCGFGPPVSESWLKGTSAAVMVWVSVVLLTPLQVQVTSVELCQSSVEERCGRDAIPPYGEGYKDLSGHQRNAGEDPTGLEKGLEGVPLAVAKQVTLTCKVPAGV